jgi:hypothetical protein
MQCTITAKRTLQTTPQQFRALHQTQLASRDALNYVSRSAFAHGKMRGAVSLPERTYREVRATFGLPAQMACSVPRPVGATYQALWIKVTANAAARAAGSTKKRTRGLDQAPTYGSPTLTYQLGRDDGVKTGQLVTLLTLEGRVVVPYTGYDRHVALIQPGARIGAAKLWYDQPQKQFYLLVCLAIAVADPTPEQHQRVVGVDVGQRFWRWPPTRRTERRFSLAQRPAPKRTTLPGCGSACSRKALARPHDACSCWPDERDG